METLDPTAMAEVDYEQAGLALALGDKDAAYDLFGKAIDSARLDEDREGMARVQRARIDLTLRRNHAAILESDAVLARSWGNDRIPFQALSTRAAAHMRGGLPVEAAEDAAAALRVQGIPDTLRRPPHGVFSWATYKLGRFSECRNAAEAALSIDDAGQDPNTTIVALQMRGAARLRFGEEGAEADFDEVLQRTAHQPHMHPGLLLEQIQMCIDAGGWTTTLSRCNRLLERDRGNSDDISRQIRATRAYAYHALAEFDKARDEIEAVLRYAVDDHAASRVLVLRGQMRCAMGHIDAANEDFDAAIRNEGAHSTVRALALSGRAHIAAADYRLAQARSDFNAALECLPDLTNSLAVSLYFGRSMVSTLGLSVEEARADWRLVVAEADRMPRPLSPDVMVYRAMATAYDDRAEAEQIVRDIEDLNQPLSSTTEVLLRTVKTQLRLSKPGEEGSVVIDWIAGFTPEPRRTTRLLSLLNAIASDGLEIDRRKIETLYRLARFKRSGWTDALALVVAMEAFVKDDLEVAIPMLQEASRSATLPSGLTAFSRLSLAVSRARKLDMEGFEEEIDGVLLDTRLDSRTRARALSIRMSFRYCMGATPRALRDDAREVSRLLAECGEPHTAAEKFLFIEASGEHLRSASVRVVEAQTDEEHAIALLDRAELLMISEDWKGAIDDYRRVADGYQHLPKLCTRAWLGAMYWHAKTSDLYGYGKAVERMLYAQHREDILLLASVAPMVVTEPPVA